MSNDLAACTGQVGEGNMGSAGSTDDTEWERHLPFEEIALPILTEMVRAADPQLQLQRVEPLSEGARNTNYKVAVTSASSHSRRFAAPQPPGKGCSLRQAPGFQGSLCGYSASANPAATYRGPAGRGPLGIVPTQAHGGLLTQAPSGGSRNLLLRIFAPGDTSWQLEEPLRHVLALAHPAVPVQALVHLGTSACVGPGGDVRAYGVYEFVEGTSLRHYLRGQRGRSIAPALAAELGGALAGVHSHAFDTHGFLGADLRVAVPLPPMREWFAMFLTEGTAGRLGAELTARVQELVAARRADLAAFELSATLTHGDFRPTNLIVTLRGGLGAVADWEFAMAGYPMADIGQLFRQSGDWSDAEAVQAFEQSYAAGRAVALPSNWRDLAALADLPNLLQMLGAPGDAPRKVADLVALVEASVSRLLS